jgi:hypothetical protein
MQREANHAAFPGEASPHPAPGHATSLPPEPARNQANPATKPTPQNGEPRFTTR